MDRKDELIRKLGLQPLPREGGYFRFISEFGNGAGMIYFLMTEEAFSHLHSLTEDESWFFLEGDAVEQTTVSPSGEISRTVLGEENRTSVVPKDYFQATRIASPKAGYALVCTVMSPRYNDDMYTHGADVRRLREMKELEDLL